MIADQNILQLSKVSLPMKHLLPEYSGIYYVLDENNNVWYIGQAKNICKRWKGKSHHRIYQLELQKKKHFIIYYERVSESQLDIVETQRIETYRPELNSTPVKTKTIRPTETLLRETIIAIADFAFILGVEPPRKDIQNQPLNTIDWMVQKRILGLSIIHICLDVEALAKKYQFDTQDWQNTQGVIRQAFSSRKAYANKWENLPPGFPPVNSLMYRLYVNGYVIEVNYWKGLYLKEEPLQIRKYIETTLAKEPINALTPESLAHIQNQADQAHYYTFCLKRFKPYNSDLIEILFNDETLEREAIKARMYKISEEYQTGRRGFGSRSRSPNSQQIQSTPITSEFNTIDELLISRGIDLQKYQKNEAITLGYKGEKIGLFIKCFNLDPKIPQQQKKIWNFESNTDYYLPIFNRVSGILNNQEVKNVESPEFDTVYLLASVDKTGWLLFEEYLKDFAKITTNLSNGCGYTNKFYVSARKYIVPAKVNIKLEKIGYSVWIPFGMNENFPTFPLAKEEIYRRLKNSGLPEIKLTFKSETTEQ